MRDLREEWRPVKGWPEYQVSNLGKVKRAAERRGPKDRAMPGRIRKPTLSSGYPMIRFTRPGESQSIYVHRLVAFAFLGEAPAPGMEVNHIDSDRSNPRADNLEWVTPAQNRQHGYDHGFCDARGARNGHSRLTDDQVRQIRAATKDDYRNLATRFSVSLATIRDVAARRTWQHI